VAATAGVPLATASVRAASVKLRPLDVGPVDQIGDLVHRAPVGLHESGEGELLAQDLDEGVVVTAAVDVVDPVVGAHDRAGAGLDAGLEGHQLGLVEGLVVDGDAGGTAAVLKIVLDVVLELGDQALALRTGHLLGGEPAGQVRVLAEGLEVAAGGRVADLVDHGAEPDVLARRPPGRADGLSVGPCRAGVECRGQPDRRRHRGLDMPEPDAGGPVGHPQRRYADPGDARNPAGLTHTPLGQGRRAGGVGAAVHHADLLRQRHLGHEGVQFGVGQRALAPGVR
jgi:hypothetical protein